MKFMIIASMLLNIAVLVPVTFGLATNASWTEAAYGAIAPARGILLAVYIAILAASAALLFKPVTAAVAALLVVQVLYKAITPFTVGTFDNPVVMSNLAIAAFHIITLGMIAARG